LAAAGGSAWARGAGHHGSSHANHNTLYVSSKGNGGAADRNCRTAAFKTVQSAVDAASNGATVVVCAGTYTEDVIISKPLTLSGKRGAVIHGSATPNGTCDPLGPTASGPEPCLAGITIKSSRVTVQGLTVKDAIGEGILATGSLTSHDISHVLIRRNRVLDNNTGGIPPATSSPYNQCVEFQEIPGDCGEGIHLAGVANSKVSHNLIRGNAGGVLLTDEFGPTHGNVVEHNIVTKNLYDCGVTAPGHNPGALDSTGKRQPSVAGVYRNVIRFNVITGNGTKGEGAGVLFANALAGTASYDNLVEFNAIAGNALAAITLHAHTLMPGQFEDLSGNRIEHNTIGKNNTGGDPLDGTTKDSATTGVLVFSGTVPVTVTIAHNVIRNDQYGIWVGVAGHVTAALSHNVFQHVTTPVFTSP
jgi:hypothetical protein